MVDISKGATRVQDKEIRSNLTPVEIRELLRDANISEIKAKLPAGISKADIDNFLRSQYLNFRQIIIQENEVKAMAGSYPPPDVCQHAFRVQRIGVNVPPADMNLFNQEMSDYMGSSKFKAMAVGKGMKAEEAANPAGARPVTDDEILGMVDSTLEDAQGFLDESWSMILDAQMMQNMKAKLAEIKGEVDRIISLVKQGVIGPEFALIAMAKVNQTKNGCLMSGLGLKMSKLNERMNKISDDLRSANPYDTGALYSAQNRSREGALNMNLLTTDMQKVMQDTSSVLDQVKSQIEMMHRTRTEMIRALRLQ